MKFATLSHLLDGKNLKQIPSEWFQEKLIVSPELDVNGTKGYVIALKLLPEQIMNLPRNEIQQHILDASVFAQEKLDVNLIQLGALTTSVTNGGEWLVDQKEYAGYVTHGDSYTAAVTCQVVTKALKMINKSPSRTILSIVGAYGIIGEAVSKILVHQFKHTILIGPREEKLNELAKKLDGNFETSVDLNTNVADIIVTATSHPTALLKTNHLKENAVVVDVSQPQNLTLDVCRKRPDVLRIDGGYVDFPIESPLPIPGLPHGKTFACIAEVIMQAMKNERINHVGSIDLDYLHKTENWAKKYGFMLNELTNFGQPLNLT